MIEYYKHTCACGCEGLIQIIPAHQYIGIPQYLRGHNTRTQSAETIAKRIKTRAGYRHSKETRKKMCISRAGYRPSEETRKKISKSKLGYVTSTETRKKISRSMFGRRHTPEVIEKMSGSNGSNWQGGISFEPYSPKFNNQLKQKIRERDNHTCQLCDVAEKEKGCKLSIHHIDYNKQNCDEDNLIALCRSCNTKVNNNRKSWTKVFQEKIKEVLCGC